MGGLAGGATGVAAAPTLATADLASGRPGSGSRLSLAVVAAPTDGGDDSCGRRRITAGGLMAFVREAGVVFLRR